MTYTAKVAVCSEIRTKHSTEGEHHIEFFLILNLVVRKETARLEKVKQVPALPSYFLTSFYPPIHA